MQTSRWYRRPLEGAGVLAALALGYVAASAVMHTPDSRRQEILSQVGATAYVAQIDSALPVEPHVGGATIVDARRPLRLAYWSQPVYAGAVSRRAVETLIQANRAEALEAHLSEIHRGRLGAWLADADLRIKELALLAEDETQRTKEDLRQDPEGHATIEATPPEGDPQWQRVMAASERLSDPTRGAVMADVLPGAVRIPGRKPAMVYHFIDFSRWPVLRALLQEYNQAVRTRLDLARRWIARSYETEGMSLFIEREQDPSRERRE